MNFNCVPISQKDIQSERLQNLLSSTNSSYLCYEVKNSASSLPLSLQPIYTRPQRRLYRKSDYITQHPYETVGSLVTADSSISDTYKVLNLKSRPNVYSKDYYDYRVETAEGIVVDTLDKVNWLRDEEVVPVDNFGDNYRVQLLDEFQ